MERAKVVSLQPSTLEQELCIGPGNQQNYAQSFNFAASFLTEMLFTEISTFVKNAQIP